VYINKLFSKISIDKIKMKSIKKCKDDEILNPLTNRCVKKSGKLGTQILHNKKKSIENPTNDLSKLIQKISIKSLSNSKTSLIQLKTFAKKSLEYFLL
jgi:hypothetical protein